MYDNTRSLKYIESKNDETAPGGLISETTTGTTTVCPGKKPARLGRVNFAVCENVAIKPGMNRISKSFFMAFKF